MMESETKLFKSWCMDEIIPGLFLGSRDAVIKTEGRETLKGNGITHILSVEWVKPDVSGLDVKHKYVHIADNPTEDILQYFEECINFIDEGLTGGGGVLVHCMMGVSRSSTIVTAYLMYRDKITFKKAIDVVAHHHPIAEPNYGFVNLLYLFEAMGCRFSQGDPLYKQHRLGQIQTGSELPAEMIANDPQENISGQTETFYKCRKCRRSVFLESSILAHIKGKGKESFKWYRGMETPLSDVVESPTLSCTSLFIEPVKWMEQLMIGVSQGKLTCPKCSGRLGSFNWAGSQCSCGSWVTPAFQIHQNRVDKVLQHRPVDDDRSKKV